MAETKTQSLLDNRTQIKTGNHSMLGLARAAADPLVAVLALFLSTAVWGRQVGTPEMITALVTFSLMYPGSVSFAVGQRGLVRDLLSQWGVVLGLMLLFGLAIDALDTFDNNVLATWIISTPLLQALIHALAPIALPHLRALRSPQNAVIIGANELGRTLARSLQSDPYANIRISAFFDDREIERLGNDLEAPISGHIGRVAEFVRANRVDQIYIALPMASQPRILRLLDDLRDTTASIYFVPDIFLYDLIQARVDTVVGLPVVAVCETPFHGTPGMLKRISDLLIASLAVLLTAPLMLALALAIKITMPGPVLFRQRRYGLDGREISVWKFRSMKVTEDGDQVRQATRDDDRITPLGSFMRRTSLDELPQFFNVLSGQMSVVGPRPHAVVHNETYRKLIKGYMIRHKVKPGITGWAQVNGARGETETVEKMERRINYDLEYLRNWSLRLDLIIIVRTVFQAFGRDPNAY
ncbi:MAG: undecaprenyl-phosphate glucose phosphotransferase [Burkholderiaceae bacterium]